MHFLVSLVLLFSIGKATAKLPSKECDKNEIIYDSAGGDLSLVQKRVSAHNRADADKFWGSNSGAEEEQQYNDNSKADGTFMGKSVEQLSADEQALLRSAGGLAGDAMYEGNWWETFRSFLWTAGTAPEVHFFAQSAPRPLIKIKAYYVNMQESTQRSSCMEQQLQRSAEELLSKGIHLEVARWPAVTFKSCTNTADCMKENPQCFPTGTWTEMYHPSQDNTDDDVKMMRGVTGNWCSHLQIIKAFEKEAADWDYLFAFEDDVIFTPDFDKSLTDLLDTVPPLWTLVAFDMFGNSKRPTEIPKDQLTDNGLPLFSISGSKGEYWGAQAWLISAPRLHSFTKWFMELPTMPLDWVPKAPRPLHFGFLAYNPGTALQRRFLEETQTWTLSLPCQNQTISDIRASPNMTLKQNLNFLAQDTDKNLKPREVVLLGMQDSGVNYVTKLIKTNLEEANKVELCKTYSASGDCGGVWQHTHPMRLKELPDVLYGTRPAEHSDFKDAVAVVVVRHPFSIFRSMQHKILDMECGSLEESDWLKKPCNYEGAVEDDTPRLNDATCFAEPCWTNLVAAWNSYSWGYLYAIQNLFHQVVLVRYEDVLESPKTAMQQIAYNLNVSLPSKIHSPGTKEDKARKIAKLITSDYKSNYTDAEVDEICSRLNWRLLFMLGYHACRPVDYDILAVENITNETTNDATTATNATQSTEGLPVLNSGDEQEKPKLMIVPKNSGDKQDINFDGPTIRTYRS